MQTRRRAYPSLNAYLHAVANLPLSQIGHSPSRQIFLFFTMGKIEKHSLALVVHQCHVAWLKISENEVCEPSRDGKG